MHETLMLLVAWVAGALLGGFFFGGLWWTIRQGILSEWAAVWFLGSLLIRMAVTLAGFYMVYANHWQRLVLCLAGFVMARLLVTWLTRPAENNQTCPKLEPTCAP
jgi:F1F0 ATPase subunit 2